MGYRLVAYAVTD